MSEGQRKSVKDLNIEVEHTMVHVEIEDKMLDNIIPVVSKLLSMCGSHTMPQIIFAFDDADNLVTVLQQDNKHMANFVKTSSFLAHSKDKTVIDSTNASSKFIGVFESTRIEMNIEGHEEELEGMSEEAFVEYARKHGNRVDALALVEVSQAGVKSSMYTIVDKESGVLERFTMPKEAEGSGEIGGNVVEAFEIGKKDAGHADKAKEIIKTVLERRAQGKPEYDSSETKGKTIH